MAASSTPFLNWFTDVPVHPPRRPNAGQLLPEKSTQIGHYKPYSSRYHSWLVEMALKELAPLFEQMHGEVG
jgi:hypothetical protein